MKIVRDSREQSPFHFEDARFDGVEVIEGTLTTGDYSIAGLESRVAVERKSLADFIGSISTGRERFEREVDQGARIGRLHGGSRGSLL